MRISVVISTLHRANSLRLTLAALRFQRHPDFEVIVVEGPSEIGWGQVASEQHQLGTAGELRRGERRTIAQHRDRGGER